MKLIARSVLALGVISATSGTASAALFSDNFDVNSTANWTVNASTGANTTDTLADFFFDYNTVGIPSAPGAGGTTRGLKMYANHSSAIFGGLSVSPTGQSFTGDYTLKFHAWLNYNGAATPGNGIGVGGDAVAPGGSGTTQMGSWGIMTSGTLSQWAGSPVYDSLFFAATHDGGSAQDYRVYPKANQALPGSGYYAAGTGTAPDARNDLVDYYNGIGGKSAPAAQLALYPQQAGTTRDGAAGFAWRLMEITKIGNVVTWKMDGLTIATVDTTTLGAFGGNNIFLGHFDTNATSSADANDVNLLFTLIDNVDVSAVPEPTSLAFLALGGLAMARRRRA